MSPPLLNVGEEEGQSNVTILASSASIDSICQNSPEFKERNYMGLSDCSSVDSSAISTLSDVSKSCLNLKATELRLGLPGSQSPEREPELSLLSTAERNEKTLFPLHPYTIGNSTLLKNVVSGNKRGFSDAMDGFSEGKFLGSQEVHVMLSPRPSSVKESNVAPTPKMKEMSSPKIAQERPRAANETISSHNNSSAPATKTQVVGWPPVRSFRKNTLATTSKKTDEVDRKAGPGAIFVKVSMDGAPYLRKVDLRNYFGYQELSAALEKMFSCFIGQYGSHGREVLSESKLKDLLHGSEYVLTYEDKDGDWMLVGDVPWEMFIDTCKRLRIMKSADAIGLAPRVTEKCKNIN